MKRALLLVPLAFSCHHATPASLGLAPDETCFMDVAGTLAADAMGGRGVGTPGLDAAATYLEGRFSALGLKPVNGSYRQPFQATTGVALGATNTLTGPDGAVALSDGFLPMGFSGSGSFSGDLVFVGYGITAPDLHYDDYAGLDVNGKVVLALRYEPGERDESSPFDGKRPTRWSDLRYKAMLARKAGAAALVVVTPPASPDEPDKLAPLRTDGPQSDAGIPIIQVSRAVAERWVKAGGGDLWALQAAIDASFKPGSQVLNAKVQGQVSVEATRAEVANIVGVLPGRGKLADEVVVVGAHYDHLGLGGSSSRAPDRTETHNGADDNASGVAAMVCGVAGLDQAQKADRRTLVVLAFSAEEIGLGGSAYYVDHPVYPLEKTVAMVNLDMVGRVRDGKLAVLGSDSAPQWKPWLAPIGEAVGLKLDFGGDGYGPSDQMSFYTRGVPVVHLFSGSHEQYHTPEDDTALLNGPGGAQVAKLLTGSLDTLITRDQHPIYAPPSAGPVMAGDSRGYGSYFGSIPDYTAMEGANGGVKLSGVRPGSPAEEAGVKAGDTLVGMGGVEVRNLYDMTFVLQDHKPGDVVDVVVLRDGQTVNLRCALRARPSGGGSTHGGGAPSWMPEVKKVEQTQADWSPLAGKDRRDLIDANERHLTDLRQLTFGGDNAEAYWSPDGRKLFFQHADAGACDRQYELDLTTGAVTQWSSGKGRTTCGYYAWPEGERVIYATTESKSADCPPPPDMSQGYVWALYDYDMVWQSKVDGPTTPFMPHPGYDAEATACFKDGRVIFTSTRDGDLELYSVKSDGTDLKRLTSTPGYDGGAYFSSDCKHMVWRASRPTGAGLDDYKRLLDQGMVRPSALEIYWANADGSDPKQLTNNGQANFGPYPMPGDKSVIFASNQGGNVREFDLYAVSIEGGANERITYTPEFDGFPMFSPDGKWLVFASNRGGQNRETNLFVARWTP